MTTLRVQLPRSLSSSSQARRHLASFLGSQGQADFAADAALIVAELVTNAVMHGSGSIQLGFDLRSRLRIEVFDGDDRAYLVVTRQPVTNVPGGRGLRLVDTLADDWGAISHHDGKTVWAELRMPKLPALIMPALAR